MLVNLFFVVTSYVMFPLAYLLKKSVRKYKKVLYPLWLYLDDHGDYGDDWWRRDNPKNFWTAYRWSVLRNPAWNLQNSLRRKKGKPFVISSKGELRRNGKIQPVMTTAVLKYVNLEGDYSDNKGEYLSKYYSVLGDMFVWYKVKDKLYWKYSFAKNVNFLNRFVELHIGITYRYTFRFKIKKVEIYEEYLGSTIH